MSLFSEVALRCNVCGAVIMTSFNKYDGRFCDQECLAEFNLRRAVSIIGIEDPEKQQPYVRKTQNDNNEGS